MSFRYRSLRNELICRTVLLFLPLITTAHVSRVLGTEGMGVTAVALNVISYFIMTAQLGTHTLGIRAAAQDPARAEQTYQELFSLQILTSLFSMSLYMAVLVMTHASTIMRIQMIRLAACMSDCSWLLKGLERSGAYTVCLLAVRVIDAVLVILFVRPGYAPLETYGLIQAGSTFLTGVLSQIFIHRLGFDFRFRTEHLSVHLKDSLKLFVPAAALKVYRIIDQGMLGILSAAHESGCYACADRMINIPFGILEGIFVLLIPGAIRARRNTGYQQYCSENISVLLSAACLICCGLFMVSRDSVILLYGKGYEEVTGVCRLLSPFVILKAYTMSFRCLYLIPAGKQKTDTLTVCAAAAVNILLGLYLIPAHGACGAAISDVVSEAGLVMMDVLSGQKFSISKNICLRTAAACMGCLIIHHALLPDTPAVRILADAVLWLSGAVWVIQTKEIKMILKRIREEHGTE